MPLIEAVPVSAGMSFKSDLAVFVAPVELCHRRLVWFSVAVTLATLAEIGYARVVPKLPQLYAVLLRAAVWDCVLVGVLVAQGTDFLSTPLSAGTDGSHFFPLAVLLYHVFAFVVCAGNDMLARVRATGRGRVWHRGLVLRRVLLELAGGTSGSHLALGRVCFIVSGGAMWLALRALLWLGDEHWALSSFIIMLFAAYCAAGFAALEPRHTLPGHLVQWLCTGWGFREALVQGSPKLVGALLLLPFAFSIIAAHIWLRMVMFLVWIIVACPCCRLRSSDDVYDTFGREVCLPLLQCSFLAFASTLAALVLGCMNGQIDGTQYVMAWVAAAYYTGMLLLWTSPMVLQAKVAFEEAADSAPRHLDYEGDASQTEPLRCDAPNMDGVELDDLKAGFEELRALLHKERHDHSIEVMQLQDKLRDAELRTRLAQRSLQETREEIEREEKEREAIEHKASQLEADVITWQARCDELGTHLDMVSRRPSPSPSTGVSPRRSGASPRPPLPPQHSPSASPKPCELNPGDSKQVTLPCPPPLPTPVQAEAEAKITRDLQEELQAAPASSTGTAEDTSIRGDSFTASSTESRDEDGPSDSLAETLASSANHIAVDDQDKPDNSSCHVERATPSGAVNSAQALTPDRASTSSTSTSSTSISTSEAADVEEPDVATVVMPVLSTDDIAFKMDSDTEEGAGCKAMVQNPER